MLPIFENGKNQKVITQTVPAATAKSKTNNSKFTLFAPKANITKNPAKAVTYQNFDNGLVSMKIPSGWVVGVGNSDYIH